MELSKIIIEDIVVFPFFSNFYIKTERNRVRVWRGLPNFVRLMGAALPIFESVPSIHTMEGKPCLA